jgi:hypothetical protein
LPSSGGVVDVYGLQFVQYGQLSRVFEIRVLRRVVGPKRDEVTGEWRK